MPPTVSISYFSFYWIFNNIAIPPYVPYMDYSVCSPLSHHFLNSQSLRPSVSPGCMCCVFITENRSAQTNTCAQNRECSRGKDSGEWCLCCCCEAGAKEQRRATPERTIRTHQEQPHLCSDYCICWGRARIAQGHMQHFILSAVFFMWTLIENIYLPTYQCGVALLSNVFS